jgi:Holliday junction resolvasome RuvABC DNA-binding subunit
MQAQRDRREESTEATLEKVRLALRSMGFRNDEVKRALVEVVRKHETREPLAVEQALREALLAATAA